MPFFASQPISAMPALIFMHCVVYMVKHVGKRIYWNKSVEEDMTILCVRCRLHLSQQGGETDWRFHLREAFYGLFYKYLLVVNLVLLLKKNFHFGSQLFQDSCFEAIKFKVWCFWVFLGLETQGAHNFFNEADQSSDYNQSSHFYNFYPCTKASFLTF